MIKLHYHPGNASFAPHATLREIGMDFELIKVDRANNAHKSSDYLKLNPAGRIPTFVDGKLVLTETAAICLHLADSNPSTGLAPPLGTPERAEFYNWLMFFTNTIQPDILMYYYNHRYTVDDNGGDAVQKAAERRLIGWYEIVDNGISDGPHVLGDTYSILDIYLLMLTRWGRPLAKPPVELARIGKVVGNALERPAIIKTIATEEIHGDFLR